MTTHIFHQKAWAHSPEALQLILRGEVPPDLASCDMSDVGWIEVGTVQLTVTLNSDVECKQEAVRQCEEAIKKVQADAQVKVIRLHETINNLLAITYEPTPAPAAKPAPNVTDVDDGIPF